MIDQAIAGDAAGFHFYWLTEMHFFKQIGHSPCPDLLHAAISQRTTRIRLGFAVLLLTTHNPYMISPSRNLPTVWRGRAPRSGRRGSTGCW